MATVQERNAELVDLLSADFIRNQSPLVMGGAAGSWGEWSVADIAGTTQTLISDGAGDVTALLWFRAIIVPSSGTPQVMEGTLAPSYSVALYTSGVNVLTLACTAAGAVTVVRTGGALTYDLKLRLEWI